MPVPAERQDRYPSAPRARSSKPSISRRRRTGSPSACPVPTSGTSPRGGGAGDAASAPLAGRFGVHDPPDAIELPMEH